MIRRFTMAAVFAVTVTACSSTDSGGVDAVGWAEKVCKSIEGQALAPAQAPVTDPGNPKLSKESLVAYLGNLASGLDKLMGGVRDAGTPKVTDGAQVVEKVTKTLQDAKEGVEAAKSNLEKATVTDAASYQAAREKVSEDLAKLSDLDDPTKDLKSNAELNDAFNNASTCKKLDAGPSTPPSS